MHELDSIMQSQGRQQFTYDVFKNAFDSDTRLQNLISDFDEKSITFQSGSSKKDKSKKSKKPDTVSKMAKDAVDLSDL